MSAQPVNPNLAPDHVTVFIDGVSAGTAVADSSGNWTFTPPSALADGPHTASATSTAATRSCWRCIASTS
mgnify:CR=1 FL=1